MQLSKYFTLADLTKTDTKTANTPDKAALDSLTKLAKTLDVLYEKVGPFSVLSGYRSPAVQAALKTGAAGSSAAAQAADKSYHSLGIAADIAPKNMSAEAFMAKIAQMTDLKNMLGEIAIKKTALHVSLATPQKQAVFMWVDSAGQYIRFKTDELAKIVERNKVAFGLGTVGLLAAAFAIYFLMKKKG